MSAKYLQPQAHLYTNNDKLEKICKGNQMALNFCVAYLNFIDLLDNLFDQDKPVTAEELVTTFIDFVANLSYNKFWEDNKNTLFPLFLQGVSAWGDSEKLKNSEDYELRIAGDVIKSYYGEMLYHVAMITGGVNHMRECSLQFRGFDFDAFIPNIGKEEKEACVCQSQP